MIQRILFASFLFTTCMSFSQEVVEWTYAYDKEEGIVYFDAEIEDGWHLYSQNINNGIGPIPTSFEFANTKSVKFLGKVSEPQAIEEYDGNFEGDLAYFVDDVRFSQKVKVKTAGDVDVTITFMVCNGETCLPPTDKIITLSFR